MDEFQKLCREVFSNSHRYENLTPEPANGPSMTAYIFPKPKEERARLCLALAIIESQILLACDHGGDPEIPATYVVTVSELLFPGIIGSLEKHRRLIITRIKKDDFPIDHFDPDADLQRLSTYDVGFLEVKYHSELEDITPEVVGGRWGIEMFPLGRKVYESNMSEFTFRQPRDLIQNFPITNKASALFGNSFAPTYESLNDIERVFARNPVLRHEIVKTWISWLDQPRASLTPQQQSFLHVFQKTENFGFYGVSTIEKFLKEYPDMKDFIYLRSCIADFEYAERKVRSHGAPSQVPEGHPQRPFRLV